MESIILTALIDAKEYRGVATIDIPNSFIQTRIDRKPGEYKITMKIKGVLVDMMVQMDPIVVYMKLTKYFETDGLKFNPYDPCVANKIL